MKRSSPKRIGILPLGGKDWIAGINYLQNIVRACNALPGSERPKFYLICRYNEDVSELIRGFELQREDIRYFAYFSSDSRRQKLRSIAGCLRRGIWPRSFCHLVKHLKIEVFAPMMEIFGSEISVPWIGWIPDFQHKHLPEFFLEAELKKRDAYFRRLCDEADHVIVSSRDGYEDLMRWFPVNERKVSVFPFPFLVEQSWYEGDPQAVVGQFDLPDKYLMFPGQFWAHKNHQTLFEALRILVREKNMEEIVLVCSGRQHDYRFPEHFESIKNFITEHKLETNIRLLGLIDRHEQIQLMRAAAAVINPSLFEGWCLMIEEARSFGKHIFLSDLAVHREQDAPKAVYFDPHDAGALAEKLALCWAKLPSGVDRDAEEAARSRLKSSGREFAGRFIEIIEKTLNARRPRWS